MKPGLATSRRTVNDSRCTPKQRGGRYRRNAEHPGPSTVDAVEPVLGTLGTVRRATASGGHFRVALAAKDLDLAIRAMPAPGGDAGLPEAGLLDTAVLDAAGAVLADAIRAGLADADLGVLID
jgi:hypothetical protein